MAGLLFVSICIFLAPNMITGKPLADSNQVALGKNDVKVIANDMSEKDFPWGAVAKGVIDMIGDEKTKDAATKSNEAQDSQEKRFPWGAVAKGVIDMIGDEKTENVEINNINAEDKQEKDFPWGAVAKGVIDMIGDEKTKDVAKEGIDSQDNQDFPWGAVAKGVIDMIGDEKSQDLQNNQDANDWLSTAAGIVGGLLGDDQDVDSIKSKEHFKKTLIKHVAAHLEKKHKEFITKAEKKSDKAVNDWLSAAAGIVGSIFGDEQSKDAIKNHEHFKQTLAKHVAAHLEKKHNEWKKQNKANDWKDLADGVVDMVEDETIKELSAKQKHFKNMLIKHVAAHLEKKHGPMKKQ